MTKSFIQFIVVSLRLYYSFIILPAQSVRAELSKFVGFTCLVLISSFFDPPFLISFVLITSYSNHLSYNNFILPFVDIIPHFNPIIFPAIAIRNCFVFREILNCTSIFISLCILFSFHEASNLIFCLLWYIFGWYSSQYFSKKHLTTPPLDPSFTVKFWTWSLFHSKTHKFIIQLLLNSLYPACNRW